MTYSKLYTRPASWTKDSSFEDDRNVKNPESNFTSPESVKSIARITENRTKENPTQQT
jgi:hypothetical protein